MRRRCNWTRPGWLLLGILSMVSCEETRSLTDVLPPVSDISRDSPPKPGLDISHDGPPKPGSDIDHDGPAKPGSDINHDGPPQPSSDINPHVPDLSPTADLADPLDAKVSPAPDADPNHTSVGVRYFSGYPCTTHPSDISACPTSPYPYIRNAHEQHLAEPQWKSLRPYFTITRSADTIDIHQEDQRVIDQEIQLAAAAGLDYFIFETSPSQPRYNLRLYLKSPYRKSIAYALLTPFGGNYHPVVFTKYLAAIAARVKDPEYFRLSNGKPILYIGQIDACYDELKTSLGTDAKAAAELTNLLSQVQTTVKQATGVSPYLVLVNWGSETAFGTGTKSLAKDLGFQARARYLGKVNGPNLPKTPPYPSSELTALNLNDWKDHEGGGAEHVSGLSYVPTVTIAFDPRPKEPDWTGPSFEQPTPAELAGRVQLAIDWVRYHPGVSNAKTVMIAAWSDITESGSLLPTPARGNSRLNALSGVLKGKTMQMPVSPFATNPPPAHTLEAITLTSPKAGAQFSAASVSSIPVTGTAPVNVRLTFQLGTSVLKTLHEVNSPTTATKDFAFELPLPPKGTYQLLITGDITPLTVNNIQVKP